MEYTKEQKELLALLPKALKNSQELTDSAKLILSNIIFLYGMEDAQKNGYVYRTNSKMMEETDIKSEHTLISAVRLLELSGYIETKRGKRKEASTYKLLMNCSNDCSNKCSNECRNEIKTLQNEVLLLQKQVVLLQKEIENLKNCSNNCSTDTDIDKEIDKENINTTGNSTNSIQVTTGKKIKKKKSLKKEKENEMNDNGMNGMNALTNEVKRNEVQTSKQECLSTCFSFFNDLEEVTTGNTTSTEDIENMRIVQTDETNNSSNEEVDAASNQTIKTSLKSNIEESETKLVQPSKQEYFSPCFSFFKEYEDVTGNTDFNECKLKTSIDSKSITVSGSNSVAEETNNSITSTQAQKNNNFNADSKKDSLTSLVGKTSNEGNEVTNTPNESETILPPPPQTIFVERKEWQRQDYINDLKKRMQLAKSQMMTKDILAWQSQFDYLQEQLNKLKTIDDTEYRNYRTYVLTPWWKKSTPYFPNQYKKYIKKCS